MKEFGYEDFEKNSVVIHQFKEQGKLGNIIEIQQTLERSYNSARP
mgnify:FL=1